MQKRKISIQPKRKSWHHDQSSKTQDWILKTQGGKNMRRLGIASNKMHANYEIWAGALEWKTSQPRHALGMFTTISMRLNLNQKDPCDKINQIDSLQNKSLIDFKTITNKSGIVVHTFNPCIQETTAKKLSVFNASLVYVVGFRTAGAVLRGPMSEKKTIKNKRVQLSSQLRTLETEGTVWCLCSLAALEADIAESKTGNADSLIWFIRSQYWGSVGNITSFHRRTTIKNKLPLKYFKIRGLLLT